MKKVLVANRGEIAVRALRAAVELGLTTVAVYTRPDRDALHRFKADEAYEIGPPERPLAGYLDVDALVEAAIRSGADALYPGYGFLSESPALASACEAAGITFVGPPPRVLELTGDKVRARTLAEAAGVPVLDASGPIEDEALAPAAAERIGYPVFVKAAGGGGGRGLRRVEEAADLPEAVATARREAAGSFGDSTVYLEKAMVRPRHIEVQVLADATGEMVHLYERDCSIQRRHQKLLEVAPAPNLDPALRDRLTADALAFAREVGYCNAGTVEFLVDTTTGAYVFIEMNPRIQVEHTVTEEITDVDLVQSQLRIAGGATLADLGLTQDRIQVRGTAVQCRITTENPADKFRPDTGTITTYRSAAGAGIRLDAAAEFVGAVVSPYFDPMLVKLTARGPDLPAATRRASRALREFRIRGVDTNIAFLLAVLDDPDLAAGHLDTSFVDDRPHLTRADVGRDRTSRLLTFVGDVTVHQPHGPRPTAMDVHAKLPPLDRSAVPPRGTRQRLQADGPDAFARWLRDQHAVAVTDTTLRDAHQSILATRVRTVDLLALAPHLARSLSGALSLEVWGGATFDAALRFLHEDPWDRLERFREAVPNVCLQMLLRGANAVGYSNYPPAVVDAFVREAAAAGVDVFRVFDAQNDAGRMHDAIRSVRDVGALAEGTLCYTGDLADPAEDRYTLDHYLGVAEQLDASGAHVLCIKDMAGVLRPPAAGQLVTALRERFPQPVHLHTHDTAGGQLATYLAAVDAGVDAVDAAAGPLAGGTSQPSLSALVAALAHHDRATVLDLAEVVRLEPFVEGLRSLYAPFDSGLRAPTGDVYRHRIPGGQLSNLVQQAGALGLGERVEEVADAYVVADELLGGLIKVTPTSKVVGDLALFLLSSGKTPEAIVADPLAADLPGSVLGFLEGDLGEPPFGWPEPLRSRAVTRGVPSRAELDDDQAAALADPARRRATITDLLLPDPARAQREMEETHGEIWRLPTSVFLYGLTPDEEVVIDLEPGKQLLVELEAVTEPDERGIRTLWCRVNGQPRPIEVRDRRIEPARPPREQADPAEPGDVAATMTGVVNISVPVDAEVAAGSVVATIEAMKMESRITAPVAGRVARIVAPTGTKLEPGDLVLEIR